MCDNKVLIHVYKTMPLGTSKFTQTNSNYLYRVVHWFTGLGQVREVTEWYESEFRSASLIS